MSRFNNLEFGGQSEHRDASHEAVKDEAYYLREATDAFERGQFEAALRMFAKVLEHDPRNVAAWAGQVRMLIELEEFKEARLWADKALEHFPNEPELLAAKAVALARLGEHKDALAFSDASIEARGDTPYVWLARGDVLLAARERKADYCFEKALSLGPSSWFWHWLAARIYYFYEKFSLALKMIQKALSHDAARSVVWLQLGYCQQALGMVALAGESFQQARELDPQCFKATMAQRQLAPPSVWAAVRSWWHRIFHE